MESQTLFAKQIQQRVDALNREIESALTAVKRLEKDRDELAQSLDTLRKHNLLPPAAAPGHGSLENPSYVDITETVVGKITVPEMIIRVLDRDYPDGAEPNQVLSRIRERFDQNADPNNVRPTMWRMGKDGRLEKYGDRYRLPRPNEAAGTPTKDAPTASAQGLPQRGSSANP